MRFLRRARQALYFLRVLLAARTVQDFLWGAVPGRRPQTNFDGWLYVIAVRLDKLSKLDTSIPHWRVEARKRLLQIAAVAVATIEWLDSDASR